MSTNTPSSDVAFTASVKALQERRGSRKAYRRMEETAAGKRAQLLNSPHSSPNATVPILRPRTARASRMSNIAADPRASFASWMTTRSALQTSSAIASTSRPATSPRTTARSCS